MTIRSPGAYIVDCIYSYAKYGKRLISAVFVVTEHPEAYLQCECVLDLHKSNPSFGGDYVLPDDGSPVYLYAGGDFVYSRMLCDSDIHKEAFCFTPFCGAAPEGADYGFTEDARFYTSTPGMYSLFVPVYFDGLNEMFGATVDVIEAE